MRNIATKVTGSSLTADEFNDIPTELENAITSTDITLSAGDLTQLSQAVATYAAGGAFYTDSGSSTLYVLSAVGNKHTPIAYFNGMSVSFVASNSNTTATPTINVAGLGVKNILADGGGPLSANDITTTRITTVVYNGAAFTLNTAISGATVNHINTDAAVADLGLVVGNRVKTDGRITANDGGDANYLVVAGATGTPDGGLYIDLDNGNQIELVLDYARTARIEVFGVVEGDATDYQAEIEAAMAGLDCILVSGDYFANNIDIPNREITVRNIGRDKSLFRTIDGAGDSEYFTAPVLWLTNSSSASLPFKTYGVGFDGGTKDVTLVIQWFFGDHEDLFILDGVDKGIFMTAKNRDLSLISSTMVNNRFENIWIQGTADEGFVIDEDAKTTDWQINNGFIFNGGTRNFRAGTMGGGVLRGVHMYGAAQSARFLKWSAGTTINSNYFENEVEITAGLNNDTVFQFGPDNTVNGQLLLTFGATAGPIRSNNNFLSSVRHDFFGSDKTFYSEGDSFSAVTPLVFTNNAVGNTAKMRIKHGIFDDGESKSGGLSPAIPATGESSLVLDFTLKNLGFAPYLSKVALISATSITHTTKVPDLVDDKSYTLIWDIGTRTNHTSTIEIAATQRWNITKKSGPTFGVTTTDAVVTTGSFTVGPTVTVTENGDGTTDIDIDATWTAGTGTTVGGSNVMVL